MKMKKREQNKDNSNNFEKRRNWGLSSKNKEKSKKEFNTKENVRKNKGKDN
jgi:hypothetical protein